MSEPRPPRDSLFGSPQPLGPDETVTRVIRADAGVYLRNALVLAVVLGALAGGVLLALGNPFPWVGPVAALAAVALRAVWLRSEALAAEWRLTDRRLLGPAGQAIPLGAIAAVRPVFGDLVVITRTGDKHLLKYLANGPAIRAAIETAAGIAR